MAHPDNAFYGHNRLLAEYAGFGSDAPVIHGHVQHGWSDGRGVSARGRLVRWLPKLVWNDRNRLTAEAEGIRPIEVIGAPFCYLAAPSGPPEPRPAPRSTIYYPFHGWDRDDASGSHRTLADAIAETESGDVTVCLYWREFDELTVRRVYEERGFRVICHGYREDPLFTLRQHAELLRHDRVASNRVATALWYGGLLGRTLAVYGPVFSIVGEAEAGAFDRYQRARWPELFSGSAQPCLAQEIAGEELGAKFVRDPGELRELLGWTADELRVAGAVKAAARAEHHARRIAYNVALRLPGAGRLPRF